MLLDYSCATSVWALAASVGILCYSIKVVYNIYFHPLSHFPGPRIAAASSLYALYHEVFRYGMMFDELPKLHLKYGLIVRIGPNELHFSDPDAYSTIYSNPHILKDASFYRLFGTDATAFTSIDPAAHKSRRDIIGPHFSRRSIVGLQSLIREKVDKLCLRIREHSRTEKYVDMHRGWRSMTLDIITAFSFGRCLNAIDTANEGFEHPVVGALETGLEPFWIQKHFALGRFLMHVVLPNVIDYLPQTIPGAPLAILMLRSQVREFIEDPSVLEKESHSVIFKEFCRPGRRKETEKSIVDEGVNLVFAGADTTGHALTVSTAHVLRSPKFQARLFDELKTAWPDLSSPPNLEAIEKLPFLTAVIKESLRHSHGVLTALPRVLLHDTYIAGARIPAGTSVSISNRTVHMNPVVFPSPSEFWPERWLQEGSNKLNRYLVSFGKGSRQCVGINLAYAEIYFGLASVFRRFEGTLVDFRKEDLVIVRDLFAPTYNGRHIRVQWVERED